MKPPSYDTPPEANPPRPLSSFPMHNMPIHPYPISPPSKMFSAFFYVLCKRTLRSLRSFLFLRKERKRTHRSFGFHKSSKTQKKNAKIGSLSQTVFVQDLAKKFKYFSISAHEFCKDQEKIVFFRTFRCKCACVFMKT